MGEEEAGFVVDWERLHLESYSTTSSDFEGSNIDRVEANGEND